MGDREKTQIKLFQTKGLIQLKKMNNYLITNGINRHQVIKVEIGYTKRDECIGDRDNACI